MKKLILVLALLPLTALAQASGPGKAAGDAGQGRPADPERMEKRMRLTRTLGLAEALDLDTAQALKMDDTLARFDGRRKTIERQAADARDALRRAAGDPKVTAAEVDGAIGKLLDARGQLQALDKETLQAVTQGLSPDRKARAALFLARFRRMEHRMTMGAGGPMRGPGMHGAGMHGHGMGAQGDDAHGTAASGDRWAARMDDPFDDD